MADGYARASGRPAVVIVTSGPGLTNTITGLGAANMDGVPMVLVCGQVPLDQIGTDAFQEADTTGSPPCAWRSLQRPRDRQEHFKVRPPCEDSPC